MICANPSLHRKQRGLALVMVLWLVVLMSIIATGHAFNVHTEVRLAAMHVQSAKARGLVDSGMSYSIMRLLTDDSSKPLPLDGTMQMISFDDIPVRIAVRDATGFIDLNTAGPDLLRMLITALSVSQDRKELIIAANLDWRDADDLNHIDGAEAQDYLANGYRWTPPQNGNFSSVEELRYVMGMTEQLFEEMAPFLTVHSEQAGLNLEFAAPFLINAMSGQRVTPAPISRSRSTASSGSGTYHVYVSAPGAGDTGGASAEAIVRLTNDDQKPYVLLYWRDSMRTRFAEDEQSEI